MTTDIYNFGAEHNLVGILTKPKEKSMNNCIVIFLNAGLLYRIGPNRLYCQMANCFTQIGFSSFRFDYSGIGDSKSLSDEISNKESNMQDTIEAMDFLSSKDYAEFIFIGICSGAELAAKIVKKDSRVKGFVYINGNLLNYDLLPPINIDDKIKYRLFKKNLVQPKMWYKHTKLNFRLFIYMLKLGYYFLYVMSNRKMQEVQYNTNQKQAIRDKINEWNAILNMQIKPLFLFSEGSVALDIYEIAKSLDQTKIFDQIDTDIIYNCDHVFTLKWSQNMLISKIIKYLMQYAA